jgi:hypothetical protein
MAFTWAMKFVLLIYQGTTPTPTKEAWKTFSEEEKKAIYAEYDAINKMPGVTPGLRHRRSRAMTRASRSTSR